MNPGLIHSSFYRSIASSILSSIDVNLHSKLNRRRTLKTLSTPLWWKPIHLQYWLVLPYLIREIVGLLSPADILNSSLTVCSFLSLRFPYNLRIVFLATSPPPSGPIRHCRPHIEQKLSLNPCYAPPTSISMLMYQEFNQNSSLFSKKSHQDSGTSSLAVPICKN